MWRGITPEARNEMVRQQSGRCLLCDKERKLEVDHCHATGSIRGMLCHSCNTKLGWYERRAKQIKQYLAKR